jgi:hypothetical protein
VNPDEYAAQQAVISTWVLNYVRNLGQFFVGQALSTKLWLDLLRLIFPHVAQARQQSAELARSFYDAQRGLAHPGLPRNDVPLTGTDFPTFVKAMEPARAKMSQADSPANALTSLALRATRDVDLAGRRQIIHAVQNDPPMEAAQTAAPKQRLIRGWARVATGRNPCAWCLMLVSRGPVYLSASNAGLNLDDTSARIALAAGKDVSDVMDAWHAGCRCIVVPVFKTESWPGQEAAGKALELWKQATREADQRIESGDSRTQNRNTEALNALRRRIANGEIDGSEYAGIAA